MYVVMPTALPSGVATICNAPEGLDALALVSSEVPDSEDMDFVKDGPRSCFESLTFFSFLDPDDVGSDRLSSLSAADFPRRKKLNWAMVWYQ